MGKDVEKIVRILQKCDDGGFCDGCDYKDEADSTGACKVMSKAADVIERLSAELEQVKRERDAAVKDIPRACGYCKHFKHDVECCDIPGCCDNPDCWNISGVNSGWEWRGVCKENS